MIKKILKVLAVIAFIYFLFICFVEITSGFRKEFIANFYFRSNLKRINLAIAKYASENSGRMPDAKEWADRLISQNEFIQKDDFISPATYSNFGVCYNANLSNRQYSELKGGHIVFFEAKCDWNASGKKVFFDRRAYPNQSHLITLNGDIYQYNQNSNSYKRLSEKTHVDPNALIWK